MRHHARRRLRRKTEGQGLLEFAIVAPILFLFVLGVFAAGQYVYAHIQVATATRLAVNQAALTGADVTVTTHEAMLALENGVTDPKKATVTVSCVPATCPRYATATVSIVYTDCVWVAVGSFGCFEITKSLSAPTEIDQSPGSGTSSPPSALPGGLIGGP